MHGFLATVDLETGGPGQPELPEDPQKRLEPDSLGEKPSEASERTSERGRVDHGYGGGILGRLKSDRS